MTVNNSEFFSENSRKSYMNMYGLACVHLWTDGRKDGRTYRQTDGLADGRTCNEIGLSRRDRKNFVKKYFREFGKILQCSFYQD